MAPWRPWRRCNHRNQTGEGQHVDVALLETPCCSNRRAISPSAPWVRTFRASAISFRVAAPANTYACTDGQVMAGILVDAHWKRLAYLIERPELADDPRYATTAARLERRSTVDGLMAAWCAPRTCEEAEAAFHAQGLPMAKVRSYAEAARDPHIGGPGQCCNPPPSKATSESRWWGPLQNFHLRRPRYWEGAPALGAHTDEILDELGFEPDERKTLRGKGIV